MKKYRRSRSTTEMRARRRGQGHLAAEIRRLAELQKLPADEHRALLRLLESWDLVRHLARVCRHHRPLRKTGRSALMSALGQKQTSSVRCLLYPQKRLFEPRLSGDGTVACATCHDPARAFTDGRTTALDEFGRYGPRVVMPSWYRQVHKPSASGLLRGIPIGLAAFSLYRKD